MSNSDKKVISDIAEFGFHIINVLEDDEGPPHTFSIGLYHTFNHPEVMIVGLKTELMQNMISWIGDDIKKGARFEIGNEYGGLLEGFKCTFRAVDKCYYK